MQRLLSPELKALPTLKTQDSVRSFVKIQLQNASAYVAAGKAFQASWDHQTEPPFTSSKNDEISGFQTPILKPRASRPKFPSKATVEQQATCRGETRGFESHSRQNIKPEVTVSRPPATNETKETKKRRAVESVGDTEEEHRDRARFWPMHRPCSSLFFLFNSRTCAKACQETREARYHQTRRSKRTRKEQFK